MSEQRDTGLLLRRAAALQLEAAEEHEHVEHYRDVEEWDAPAILHQEQAAELYWQASSLRAAALGQPHDPRPPKAPKVQRSSPLWDLLPKTRTL